MRRVRRLSFLFALSAIVLSACVVPNPDPSETLPDNAVPNVTPAATYNYGPLDEHKLDAYRPANWKVTDKRPVMVYIHGGGWASGSRDSLLDVARAQLNYGWVMLSIDYRLAPANPYPAAVQDLDRAIRWVRSKAKTLGVDPNQLVTLGHSAGSNLALLQAAAPTNTYADPTLSSTLKSVSSRPQAVVDLAGPTDLFNFNIWDKSNSVLNDWLGCPKSAPDPNASMNCSAAKLRAASPITYVSADDPPLYLAHGDNDFIVRVNDATSLHDRYVAVGRDKMVWLDVVDSGPDAVRWHFPDHGLNYAQLQSFLTKVTRGELT